MNLAEIQDRLRAEGLDGWLFFDHHGRDPIAYRVLGLEVGRHVSRRWYYWIPAAGEPLKLTHRIEHWMLDGLPGDKKVYASWREQGERLSEILTGADRLAMQYSPNCMIPYVSLVDGGTIDLVRSLGKRIASSAALVQYFEARWDEEQREAHVEAGRRVDAIRRAAFERVAERLRLDGVVREFAIAQFILERFADEGLASEDGPIVAVNANASNPHYAPSAERDSAIRAGDFVLIDLWAKLKRPRAVYYDVTWTGYCGAAAPAEIERVFDVVRRARDEALRRVDEAVGAGVEILGCDVDDACRGVIAAAGLGASFIHRTGHSIGEEVHGNGANMDNLETRDERPVIPRTCFSIEPGVYLKDFGVRSEIDCWVSERGAAATGEVQQKIVLVQ